MEVGLCSQCGRRTFIQNKTRCLCPDCVYRNNHGGKSKVEVAREKRLQNANKGIKKAPKSKKRRSTGELHIFREIWRNRAHFCVNCGKYLGEEPCSYMFSHRVAKGVSESVRLDSSNIDLLCFDCHFARDMQGGKVFEKRGGKI